MSETTMTDATATATAARHFGAAAGNPPPQGAATRLRLCDGPLDLSWHHCSSTSDFLGEFFATQSAAQALDYNEARHSIGYLANELLENAIKFRAAGDITVDAWLDGATLALVVRNAIDAATAARFQALLAELTAGDPGDLLIQRIEANAADPGSGGSGLGLLTLMSDYGARLGWHFVPAEDALVALETQARLDLV